MDVLMLLVALSQAPRRVAPDAPSAVQPVYREIKAGEERVEGLLQRVECPPGRPVTFVVKLKDRVVKYQAPRLDAVEYIAHTPDFRGPMSCGGPKFSNPLMRNRRRGLGPDARSNRRNPPLPRSLRPAHRQSPAYRG